VQREEGPKLVTGCKRLKPLSGYCAYCNSEGIYMPSFYVWWAESDFVSILGKKIMGKKSRGIDGNSWETRGGAGSI
jgi:hypothetical protein